MKINISGHRGMLRTGRFRLEGSFSAWHIRHGRSSFLVAEGAGHSRPLAVALVRALNTTARPTKPQKKR